MGKQFIYPSDQHNLQPRVYADKGVVVVGVFSAIKNIGSTLLGTPKLMDAAIKAGDALFYTKEEEVQDRKEFTEQYLQVCKALGFDSVQSQITRRLFGIIILLTWNVAFFVALIFCLLGREIVVDNIIALADSFKIGWSAITVVSFYFVRHILVDKSKK